MSFINSHSRLTIDPCIQRAAKDVVRYAQEVARKSDHAASDLLITAVWSCLNCSCGLRTKPWPESAKKPANKVATTAKSKVTASLSNKDTTSKGTLNKPAQQSAGTCQNNSDKTGSQVNKDTDGKSSELSKKQYVDKSENTDNQTEEIDDAIVLSDDVDGDDFEIELNPEVSDDKSGAVNGKEADSNDNDDKNEDLLDMDCDEIDEEEEHQLLYDEKKDKKKTESANKPETDLSEDDEITIITDDDDKQSNDESKNTKSADTGKDKVKKTNIVSRSDVISLDTDSDEGGLAKHRKNVCSETNIDTVRIKTECDMDDMMMDTDSPTKNTATGLRNYEKDFVEAPTAQAEMDTVVDVKVELDTNEYDISRRTIPPVPPETEAHTSPQTNLVLPQPGTSFAQTDTSLTQSSIMPNLGTIQQAVSQPQVQNMLVPSMLGLVPLQQAGQSSCPQPNTITETTITYYTQSGSGVPGGQKIQVIERQSLITDSGESPPSKMRLLDFDKKWHSAPKVDLEQEKYLALPGGIEANSVMNAEDRQRKLAVARDRVTDWMEPGLYTSISNYPTVPTVQMENVGEMIAQGHSLPTTAVDATETDTGEEAEEESSDDEDKGKTVMKKKKTVRKTMKKTQIKSSVKGKIGCITAKQRKNLENEATASVRGKGVRGRPPLKGRGKSVSKSTSNDRDIGKKLSPKMKAIVKVIQKGQKGAIRGQGRGTRGRGRPPKVIP